MKTPFMRSQERKSDKQNFSRRGFLKGGAVAGVSGAAIASGIGPAEAQSPGITWDIEVDVVVVGGGPGGLLGALAAADEGASVILVEQNFDVGGLHGGGRRRVDHLRDEDIKLLHAVVRHRILPASRHGLLNSSTGIAMKI